MRPPMLTLGIETSGPAGSVALVTDGCVLGETELAPSGRRHARTLVAELRALLQRCDRQPGDVDCAAVSIGPGSFTGLRVGTVCAKTFAYATGCRLVAVESLEAIAATAPPDAQQIDVVLDALRGDVFHARYRHDGVFWKREGNIGLVPWTSLAARCDTAALLTGPALATIPADLWPAPRLDPACWSPRASSVALIGERQARKGAVANPWTLEPLYIRPSAAEERMQAHASS